MARAPGGPFSFKAWAVWRRSALITTGKIDVASYSIVLRRRTKRALNSFSNLLPQGEIDAAMLYKLHPGDT